MSRDTRYVITRSNYTIKEKHKELDNYTIFERDFMTTTNLGGYDSGSIPYGESNFKMVTNDQSSYVKKNKNNGWLMKEGCTYSINEDLCSVWTIGDVGNTEEISNEGKIVIKPNKNSLLDYAYYGSCVELIKVSVNNIIKYFPGELYVSSLPEISKSPVDQDYVTFGSNIFENPVLVENPFNINITDTIINREDDYNEYRYFADSVKKYRVIDASGNSYCISNWVVNGKKKKCYKYGDIVSTIDIDYYNCYAHSAETRTMTIYNYYCGDHNVLIADGNEFSGYRIRPSDEHVNEIFETKFKQFETFLLNRYSNPLYSISIDTPIEKNTGIIIGKKNYTWPTKYGWNIEINGGDYSAYLNSLLDVAQFYDDHNRTNVLWNNLTHDSIKNMDTTFSNPQKNEDISDYRLGISNIHGLLNAYGRQFDEIKLTIKNIKSVNNITYSGDNNIPDYFLSDTNQLSGWEVTNVTNGIDKTVETNILYESENKKYNSNDLNAEFLKNLKINSRAIFQHKGTRYGIEMLLSLFGLCSYEYGKNYYESLPNNSKLKKKSGNKVLPWHKLSDSQQSEFYDYKLNEYVVVARNKAEDIVPEDEELPAETYTKLRKDYYSYSEYEYKSIYSIPVRLINLTGINNNQESVQSKYIIPWFDKNETLDADPYFQMNGGWVKNENGLYSETKQYMPVVQYIHQLQSLSYDKISNNSIVYVNDISDFGNFYSGYTAGISPKPSNYFYIDNVEYSYLFGEYGWKNIEENKLKDGGIDSGITALYLESIISNNVGNNPHVGYGKYDAGDEYLQFFKQIFYGTIKEDGFSEDAYDCNTGELLSGITEAGFDLTEKLVDNIKCWYFTDTYNNNSNKLYHIENKYVDVVDDYGDKFNISNGYELSKFKIATNVGKKAKTNKEVFFETEFDAWNLETQENASNDEAAANSIINIKNMTLEFNRYKYDSDKEFKNYFHESIMPYLKQMIPSTTIFEVINIDPITEAVCKNFATIVGISN